jgi:hypothetical protein
MTNIECSAARGHGTETAPLGRDQCCRAAPANDCVMARLVRNGPEADGLRSPLWVESRCGAVAVG